MIQGTKAAANQTTDKNGQNCYMLCGYLVIAAEKEEEISNANR
jgi:hypothetical protein